MLAVMALLMLPLVLAGCHHGKGGEKGEKNAEKTVTKDEVKTGEVQVMEPEIKERPIDAKKEEEAKKAAQAPAGEKTLMAVDTAASTLGWKGCKPVGCHWGTIGLKDGSVEMTGDTLTGGKFTIDMSSIAVDPEDLQGDSAQGLIDHLEKDDFFDVANHPEAFAMVTDVTATDAGYDVTLDLNIKGTRNEVVVPATVTTEDGKTVVMASFEIDRTQWGITFGSDSVAEKVGDAVIADAIEYELKLVTQ